MKSFEEKLSDLAETFPSLRGLEGIRPFNPEILRKNTYSSGQGAAVDFILNLYNSSHPFNLGKVIGNWDDHHQAAFAAWAKNPFWC